MPKYLSSTDRNIRQHSLQANIPYVVEEFIQNLPAGVTVDKTIGNHDPIIGSQKFTIGGTYTLPTTDSAYSIEVFCTTGEISFKVNGTGNTCTIGVGMKFERKCQARVIETLVFTISSGTAYVVVTKE